MPPRQKTGGRTKATLFLLLAFVVAILVAVAVRQVVSKWQKNIEAANQPPETIPVVVATRDLYTGIPIGPEDVAVREVVPNVVPEDLIFGSVDEVLGRTPRERVLTNEVVRTERIARPDLGVGLNAIITPGKRAMTVATDVESGLAGFLRPGNFVDVIVTIQPDDVNSKAYMTETILQGIKVLAVGSSLNPSEEDNAETASAKQQSSKRRGSSATLELTLEEAEKLAFSSRRGHLHLVLRSDVDITQVDTEGKALTASSLIGWDPAKPTTTAVSKTRPAGPRTSAKPTEEPAFTTEIIQGGNVVEVKYDEQGNKISGGTQSGRKPR